ncbi:MerR family transcriptional regulator [Amycolatopsis sp. 195334CR]|uniref:DNA polymerase III subunit beta family protein n=1 Tax=Amycolatopsis sp. 195334CR TaxID=2814588 RepID=UPI001A8DF224|nr:MerR family transcriptional regulator [Amycolatopsis sp. 195334CR]MBN6035430.1 MerR family transcriptional regulator [Amycolatopsis sp. 195334CR]
MTDPELMPIGAFAKRAGLTASALRFYDDAGLLHPDRVDPWTGYRLYREAQLAHAAQLRRLREIGMPLPVISEFFAADAEEAARLIDEQVAKVTAEATEVRRAAATLKAALGQEPRLTICVVPGPVLAAAVDQVLATTDPEIPVLGGVRLETDDGALALVATDRYRLALRTVVPTRPPTGSWAGTLAGDDLRASSAQLRRSSVVTIEAGERTVGLRTADDVVLHCRLLTEEFPDYRLLLGSLPPVTHRVTLGKQQVMRVLEQRAPETVGIRVSGRPSLLIGDGEVPLDGSATGAELVVWFELTTLYPALSQAIGPDLMLDLRGADQPATVRSADDGDLTTLVMPCRKDGTQP